MIAADKFAGKIIGVFGLGRTGRNLITALEKGGAEVWAFDDNADAVASARSQGLPIVDFHQCDFSQMDSYVVSPGVPLTHPKPHWSVLKAHQAGVEVIGDTEIFVRQIVGSGARVIAITGTNGKSTTTALIGHMLRSSGIDAEIGGNIGTAVFKLSPPSPEKVYVLELSSYQLDLTPGLKADVAILLNLSPDHLDRHGDMQNYAAVKAKIFANQQEDDTAVISLDDDWCSSIAAQLPASRKVPISVARQLPEGVSAVAGKLADRRGETIQIDLREMRGLNGRHNWQNACAAYAAGRALGLSVSQIARGLESFAGLVHRMENVGQIGDVLFVNDSKGTNADATAHALASFSDIYWIAGGRAKAGGIAMLEKYFDHVKAAYLIGEAADDFARTLSGKVPFHLCETLDIAVEKAARDALAPEGGKAGGESKAVVLLSPAAASFDQYESFEKRGDHFRDLVAGLKGIELNKGVAA